jgi:hypothetical protein
VTGPVSGPGVSGQARTPIAVFLLDDHEVVRRGVRDLLETEPDIRVVREAGTSSALARIPALHPHDISGEVKRRFLPGLKAGVSTPPS